MNTSFPDSTGSVAESNRPSDEQTVRSAISQCSADAENQDEFLKLVASELSVAFHAGIVAVELGDAAPTMLVSDDLLAAQIDRGCIREALSNAVDAAIACDLPLSHAASVGPQMTRGLSVRIQESPKKSAFLLIYGAYGIPSTVDQIEHLKQLRLYADAIRTSIAGFATDVQADQQLLAEQDQVQTSPSVSALRNRQSLQLFHRDLDVDATAYRIANESRRLLECDRVTVLLPRANRYRVSAISGVRVFDARSNSVRRTEELTQCASVMSRPLTFPSDEALPPQVVGQLDAYLDETGVTAAIMLPLHRCDSTSAFDEISSNTIDPFAGTGDIVGVLMLEYFSGDPPKSIGPEIRLISSEAVLALQNSLEHRKVFGLGFWKLIGTTVQALRRPLIALAVFIVASLLIASACVPVEHYVIATGASQPADQRQVFANVDGIVKRIHVTDGQEIKAGDPILDLENAELESQAEAVSGEILTTAQRLASIRTIRLTAKNDPSQSGRLVMEERQLQSKLTNLKAQQALINKQQQDLKIVSPIDGTVVAWQLDQRLSDRPVARGNLLVSVVDHSGPWLLRLTVPDQNAGPVLDAFQGTPSLPVRFAVATVPDASFAATLNSVSTATRMNENGQHVIDVVATVGESDSDQSAAESLTPFNRQDVRPGADVTAKIACGQRTILRSWFSDVFDFVDRNVLFYFR